MAEPRVDEAPWGGRHCRRGSALHPGRLALAHFSSFYGAQLDGAAGTAIDVMVPVVNFMDDRPGRARSGDQRGKYDAFLTGSPRRSNPRLVG